MAKFTTREKVGNLSQFVTIMLCQSPQPVHNPGGCGKLLWKNLLRMWKSASYQQVFRVSQNPPRPVEKWGDPGGDDPGAGVISRVTLPGRPGRMGSNPGEKVGFLCKNAVKAC